MVAHAMAKDDVRDYLNGVYIEIEGGDITFVATDGHRLATTKVHVITRQTECFYRFKHQFAIRNADIVILQLLLKHSPTVSVAFFPEYAEFSGDDWVLACQRLNEYYPTWQSVIPRDEQPIQLSRTNMLDLVLSLKQRKASKFNGVTISIDAIGILTVHSRGEFNADTRVEVTDRIELDYAYQPMINGIGFNRKYLISALEVAIKAGVNVATFGFTNEHSSISVRFDDFIGVVMPMKI
jgi:DNA polymerase-3 subunit beta